MARAKYDLPDVARRLEAILRELRYEKPNDAIDRDRACKVVNRRSRREMKRSRFDDLLTGKGSPMTAEEAVHLADGLGFDVRKLLYEEGSIPRKPERPENLLDELDILARVRL